MYYILAACLVRFKENGYSVVEGTRDYCVDVEKLCTNSDLFEVSVGPLSATTPAEGNAQSIHHLYIFKVHLFLLIVGIDFVRRQRRSISFPPGPPTEMRICFTVIDDSVVECNETFPLSIVELDAFDDLVDVDPEFNVTDITIIDDDGKINYCTKFIIIHVCVATPVIFQRGSIRITEGGSSRRSVIYETTSEVSFNVTVESFLCLGNNAATRKTSFLAHFKYN